MYRAMQPGGLSADFSAHLIPGLPGIETVSAISNNEVTPVFRSGGAVDGLEIPKGLAYGTYGFAGVLSAGDHDDRARGEEAQDVSHFGMGQDAGDETAPAVVDGHQPLAVRAEM